MAVTANWVSLIYAFGPVSWLLTTILLLGEFLYFNLRPIEKSGAPTKRIWYLKSGCELLRLFLITATVTVFVQMVWLWCQISMITPENSLAAGTAVAGAAFGVLWAVLLEAIVFWNGMIRVYLTSVQLGLKHRVLADRIRQILAETGCEKVNIIAHSKGGLDSRAAIAHAGCAPCVASLTTINTPHRGCIFAEYLLKKIPAAARQKIADTYNAALKRLGDEAPDFLAAVTDLTASACEARNAATPDAPGVFYQSVMSYCRKAQHGKFPLNMTYPIVKHFDGLNDGLVAVDSAKWGDQFTLLEPRGHRGISHGDVVDLNRENIPGFDVREFYVSLVADLKNRGF